MGGRLGRYGGTGLALVDQRLDVPDGTSDWPTGLALGIGGLAGAYTGARIQRRLPDTVIRRVMGVLVVAIGARYLWSGLS